MQDAPPDPSESGYFEDAAATFGDRLVAAREAQGLSQTELASRLGVLPRTVRNWEDDRSEPRANKLQMLCGLLNVSMLWLISGSGEGGVEELPEEAPIHGDLLMELRTIRAESMRLSARIGRLEKSLRGILG